MPLRRHRGAVTAALAVVTVIVMLWSITVGAADLSASELMHSLARGPWRKLDTPFDAVLWYLRMPRVLLAALVGATLSVAGAMMQGLFRNPLADPGLIGVSGGAALGAVAIIMLGAQMPLLSWIASEWILPVAALFGALVATILIYHLATIGGYTSVATLLLAGVAINAFVGAGIGFATYLADDVQLRTLNFWMLGSLGGGHWGVLAAVAPFCLLLLAVAPHTAHALNAFALGEAEAGHLGFRPERVKRWLIVLTSFGVGACVSHTGMIGFIGLVVPHLVRLSIGPDHRWLIPCAALLGAALLTSADSFARTAVAPAELPIGIVTAAVGAPFFLWLLVRQRKGALHL